MQTFNETFNIINHLTDREQFKPLSAMNGKLMEEVGELSTAILITEGHITHKQLSEPIVGEVADVVQNALAILVKATPDMLPEHRLKLFLIAFEEKTNKWHRLQRAEYEAMQMADAGETPATCQEDEAIFDQLREQASIEETQAHKLPHYDPAAEYTAQTGRHLTLEERMQERLRHSLHQSRPDLF